VTKPTGAPRGRPPKQGPKRPAHRPVGSTEGFFKAPDRYLLAYYGALRVLGQSPTEASTFVAAAKDPERWSLNPDELHAVNSARKRKGKGQLIPEGAIILSPPAFTTLEGRASTIRKKFNRAQTNPVAAHWLKIMVQAIAVPRALDGERMPLPEVLFALGAEVEAYVKGIDRSSPGNAPVQVAKSAT
jgi:hypothetical protein